MKTEHNLEMSSQNIQMPPSKTLSRVFAIAHQPICLCREFWVHNLTFYSNLMSDKAKFNKRPYTSQCSL